MKLISETDSVLGKGAAVCDAVSGGQQGTWASVHTVAGTMPSLLGQ